MDRTPVIVPVSELRQDAAGILRRAAGSQTPVYVTQRGRLAAVLLARPVYERLRSEHEILCRVLSGELDVALRPGVDLEEVLRRGERAVADERLAVARELAAEARRLEDREREPATSRPPCTLEEFYAEMGTVPDWPGTPAYEAKRRHP
jgi:prevent-host-death family protein